MTYPCLKCDVGIVVALNEIDRRVIQCCRSGRVIGKRLISNSVFEILLWIIRVRRSVLFAVTHNKVSGVYVVAIGANMTVKSGQQ